MKIQPFLHPTYSLKLRSVGNPDYGQYAPISEPRTVIVESLRAAVEECLSYIAEWDLGGGNWTSPTVYCNGKPICKIAYNGSLWSIDGQQVPLLEGGKEVKIGL